MSYKKLAHPILQYSTLYRQYTVQKVHCTDSTLYSVQTVHCTNCTLYRQYTVQTQTVHCTDSTLYRQYTVQTVHRTESTLYSSNCTLYIHYCTVVQMVLYTVQTVHCTVHCGEVLAVHGTGVVTSIKGQDVCLLPIQLFSSVPQEREMA